MAGDATLEVFLAAAAPLRVRRTPDPLRMFELLHAVRLDRDDALSGPVQDAIEVSSAALAAPGVTGARSAAIARYAFERVAIAIEGRLRPASAVRGPVSADVGQPRARDSRAR